MSEATPRGRKPEHVLRDRDASYGEELGRRATRPGIGTRLTPIRAPRANAIAERVVGTFRRECPDHLIVLNARHLRTALRELVRYDNADRPHRSLGLETPEPATRPEAGPVRSRPVLGGLHHVYERVA
jgi:transposase InsO family protein